MATKLEVDPRVERDRRQFASDLQLMRHRAGTLGLYATMQKLDPAVSMVGFEIAGDITGGQKWEESKNRAKR